MVAANEVFAISQGSVIEVFSALDYEETVERDEFAAKQLPSCQAALDFELAFGYILADLLSSAPHSHVIHDVQSRGSCPFCPHSSYHVIFCCRGASLRP